MGGSCDEDEGRKGTQEGFERIRRREKSSWKTSREMDRCSGQGCLEAEDLRAQVGLQRHRRRIIILVEAINARNFYVLSGRCCVSLV